MSLRHQVLVDFPDPKYSKYGNEPFVTTVLYHGGSIVHSPKAEYVGGTKSKFDIADISRKGVVVDDGNGPDLDQVEWDEVFKIVDSYAEGNGPSNEQIEVEDDESDRLFEDGLEDSGYELEDNDSEHDNNVDCSGGEDSGQEEESSDSEDTNQTRMYA
ncbi:hypothetical protein Salat_1118900 [Sesamum alatum]|uniref:Uncharacterized protein n=1 Tax=Sesamum alatum TaxID=300844 RepID=A0AAE2CT54_9LAMI|nr:hypothetical protein Salat_1118900 [Sesamum alatum]